MNVDLVWGSPKRTVGTFPDAQAAYGYLKLLGKYTDVYFDKKDKTTIRAKRFYCYYLPDDPTERTGTAVDVFHVRAEAPKSRGGWGDVARDLGLVGGPC